MAHYAFLNDDDVVTEVIVGIDETELIEGKNPEQWYADFRNQKCLRTSYNGKIRKNFAGVGFIYDENLDAFIAPQPYPSWKLNKNTATWEAPKVRPEGLFWLWNEDEQEWING